MGTVTAEPWSDEQLERFRFQCDSPTPDTDPVKVRIAARWLATLEARDAEIARLREANVGLIQSVDACIDHLRIMEECQNGWPEGYVCAVCGAGDDDDHRPDCKYTLSMKRLASLAVEPTDA